MTIELIPVTDERLPLDLLLWRRFKREVPGLVEATYALNQNLADAGPFLPVGVVVKVEVPEPPKRGRSALPVLTLFG